MKLKLDKETAQALTNLRASSDFRTILNWLAVGRSNARDVCQTGEGMTLFRAQGAASVLSSILKCMEDAPEVTEKFKQ